MTQSKKEELPHLFKLTTFETYQVKSCQDDGIYSSVSHTSCQQALKATAAAVPPDPGRWDDKLPKYIRGQEDKLAGAELEMSKL